MSWPKPVPPVERYGGEILKFIGDAMLAIFPLHTDRACERALEAAIEARAAMKVWNSERRQQREDTLKFGIALHAGDVMCDNIGAANRFDFIIIGPAVNIKSRIEGMCRRLGFNILMSGTFADLCAPQFALRSLGTHRLTNIARPVELFTVD